jgi:hypothetical protein
MPPDDRFGPGPTVSSWQQAGGLRAASPTSGQRRDDKALDQRTDYARPGGPVGNRGQQACSGRVGVACG